MVILHETLKLLHYAEAEDVKFFRIGTSGGLGIYKQLLLPQFLCISQSKVTLQTM